MTPASISAFVAVEDGIDRGEVRDVLAAMEEIDTVAFVEGLETAAGDLADFPSDAILLACHPDSERALWFIRDGVRAYPGRPIVVISAASANGFVRHAFDAGADDLVMPTAGIAHETDVIADQVRFALEKAVARRSGTTAVTGSPPGSLVCVLGPKGGIGKTLTSANLAVALAQAGRRVVVVDLDLQFGDVGLTLGLAPQRTIYDLVKSGGTIDAEKLTGYLTSHETGVRVLMAPVRPDQASAVTIEFLRDLYPLLRSISDVVIVDTPPGFSPEVIASIDASTHVCMVGMLDALSLKNTKLGLETLELMGYAADCVQIVLNRADASVGVTLDDVVAVIGRRPDVMVPSHRDVVRSVNEGTPIVAARPRSDVSKAFTSLAATYAPQERERAGRRLLRRRKG